MNVEEVRSSVKVDEHCSFVSLCVKGEKCPPTFASDCTKLYIFREQVDDRDFFHTNLSTIT